jgi:hypothetical protein
MASKRIFNWLLDIICVACVGFVVWHYYFPSPPRPGDYTGLVGSKVKLKDVTWSDSPRTVVLALSRQCQFCKMSAEFYRALIDSARPDRFRVVAVLQKPAQQSELNPVEFGIEKVRDIRETDLKALGVRLTPSVMVVDRRGVVEAAWAGNLSASTEAEIFRAVKTEEPPQFKRPASLDDSMPPVQAGELRTLLKDPNTVVLDIRERSRFYEAHIRGSLNMPIDEIEPRAPHELPADRTILMYCVEYLSPCCTQGGALSTVPATRFVPILCKPVRRMLEDAGFTKVRSIADDLVTLKQAGVPVDGKPHP